MSIPNTPPAPSARDADGECKHCAGAGLIDESDDGVHGTRCDCTRPGYGDVAFGHIYRVAPEGCRERPWRPPGVVFDFGPAPAEDGGVMQYMNLYTTPPASVPVAELVALAEKWREDANGAARYSTTEHEDGRILEQRACANELTALAQKGDARGQC